MSVFVRFCLCLYMFVCMCVCVFLHSWIHFSITQAHSLFIHNIHHPYTHTQTLQLVIKEMGTIKGHYLQLPLARRFAAMAVALWTGVPPSTTGDVGPGDIGGIAAAGGGAPTTGEMTLPGTTVCLFFSWCACLTAHPSVLYKTHPPTRPHISPPHNCLPSHT